MQSQAVEGPGSTDRRHNAGEERERDRERPNERGGHTDVLSARSCGAELGSHDELPHSVERFLQGTELFLTCGPIGIKMHDIYIRAQRVHSTLQFCSTNGMCINSYWIDETREECKDVTSVTRGLDFSLAHDC